MAEISSFFNSVNGDRRYLAEDFAKYFHQFLTNGVYHLNFVPTLEVKTNGTNLTVFIEPGSALINGYMYENTSNKILQIEDADPNLNRIDRVVLRMNRNQEARNITAHVVKGLPALVPIPPTLTRDNYIHEISLAQIYVTRGTTFIGENDITDERLNESVCGLVRSLITDSFAIITDAVTGQQYSIGIENGVMFLEKAVE